MKTGVLHRYSRLAVGLVAIAASIAMARSIYSPGTIGYVDDWNIPSTAHGLWIWGISDFSPWRPIEYGLPVVYPTDFYLKLGLGIVGLSGASPQVATALFVTLTFAAGFIGLARLAETLWNAGTLRQIAAGLFYVGSPVLFDAFVPGYITFMLSYAALPWMAVHLVRALRGQNAAWYGFAFFMALSLAQIQFGIFDLFIVAAVLLGMRAPGPQWARTAFFMLIGGVLTYAFLFVNLFGVHELIASATRWTEHSWTSLNAPGLRNAVMLVPSAYAYFDQSLGDRSSVWRDLAMASIALALVAGFASGKRIGQAFAALLVLSLIFLHGANPPLTQPMTWFMSLGPLAILRNINYVFVVVALCTSLLVAAPRLAPRVEPYYAAAIAAFALFFALPFLANTYAAFLTPVPGPNTTQAIVGEDHRTLVLPHLQVVDKRHKSVGGMNPNSVETITPIFVRDTPTGILQASILNRLTDWTPQASAFDAVLRAARVNGIALQTQLGSTFPKFVYADRDEWLNDAYITANIKVRLDENADPAPSNVPATALYRARKRLSDAQTADAAVAVSGSVEDEVALRATGMNGIFLPAELLDAQALLRVRGVIQNVGAPDFIASPDDLKTGAYVAAGSYADAATTDFHTDWVDPMAASDWWFDVRLLVEPHAAITDKPGAVMTIPIPKDRRHLWLEYYASEFGGRISVSGPVRATTISTRAASLGEYRWIDLGSTRSADGGYLTVTSLEGFNGVGNVAMLSANEERADATRLRSFARFGRVQVLPNATFAGETPITISSTGWHPSIMLGSLSPGIRYKIQALARSVGHSCDILIGRATLSEFTVLLDGAAPASNDGDLFRIAKVPCDRASGVALDGVTLGAHPRFFEFSSTTLHLKVDGRAQILRLPFLPLAFPPLQHGRHTLSISSPPLFSEAPAVWTMAAPVTPLKRGGVRITLSAAKYAIDTGVKLRVPRRGEHLLLTGSYTVSKGALARVMFYSDKPEAMYDMPGDGQPRYFHWDLSRVPRIAGDQLYVGLDPKGTHTGHVTMMLNQTIPYVSANLLLMEPGFSIVSERQLRPQNLRFLRFGVGHTGSIVQYDQTYDKGWTLQNASRHIESTSGFNVWMIGNNAQKSSVVRYRTGVAYVVAAVFSLCIFLMLGLLTVAGERLPKMRNK